MSEARPMEVRSDRTPQPARDLICDGYLQDEQEDFEQDVQPPPCDGVNFPPLFEPKTENFFVTFLPPHDGQETLIAAPLTNRSNSLPQRLQTNSKIGTAAPSRT